MAASWLVRRLVPVDVPPGNNANVLEYTTAEIDYPILTAADELPTLTKSRSLGTSVILDRTLAKLQLPLTNSTAIPLEIDVLKAPRKKELLYIVFAQVQTLLDELRFLEINYSELLARKNQIAQDIWRKSSQKFLGVFYTEQTTKTQDEIDKIHLLKAELAYLASPERLKALNDEYVKLSDTNLAQMEIDPINPSFVAKIRNIDLKQIESNTESAHLLRNLLSKYKVLIFENQKCSTPEEFESISSIFGSSVDRVGQGLH
jgi:hypothetical protein